MAKIPYKDKVQIERLLEMGGGYVLDFSNASFREFVLDSVNIDIESEPDGYPVTLSKAKRLRVFIEKENDSNVGKLLKDLLLYSKDIKESKNKLSESDKRKIEELILFFEGLIGNELSVILPDRTEDTFQTIVEDIRSALGRKEPTLVLDRLHTFSAKYLRELCANKGINILDGKGNNLPLHSLAGMLNRYYIDNGYFESEFTATAIKSSISLFDKFNHVRNNSSYAHDNQVMNAIEADFIVKTMANFLIFIENIERLKQSSCAKKEEAISFDFPF